MLENQDGMLVSVRVRSLHSNETLNVQYIGICQLCNRHVFSISHAELSFFAVSLNLY